MRHDADPREKWELTPREAMNRMRWCDRDDIYVLNGGIEKRMSTLSQQYRAISLVGSLIDEEKIVPDTTCVVIIGAGIAGVTAAAVSLTRGYKHVELYEKRTATDQIQAIASTFESSQRLIDPRLYEWPTEDWRVKKAGLPLLD